MRRPMGRRNQESSTYERRPEGSARQSAVVREARSLAAVPSGGAVVSVLAVTFVDGRRAVQLRVEPYTASARSARMGPRRLREIIAALEDAGRETFGERWGADEQDHAPPSPPADEERPPWGRRPGVPRGRTTP